MQLMKLNEDVLSMSVICERHPVTNPGFPENEWLPTSNVKGGACVYKQLTVAQFTPNFDCCLWSI